MDWIVFSAIIFIIFFFVLYCIFIPYQLSDMRTIKHDYKHMLKHDKKNNCINYLRKVNRLPTWRICLAQTFLITTFCILFICLITSLKIRIIVAIYLMIFITSFIVTYKAMSHRYWHYICPEGCIG